MISAAAGGPLPTSIPTGVAGPFSLAMFGDTRYVEPSAGSDTQGALAAGTVATWFVATVTVAPVHVSTGGVVVPLDLLHAATAAKTAATAADFIIRIVWILPY
jgi:hypothetical protein